AISKEDAYWGGHSLKGLALFYRARQKETADYADKVKALRSADQYFKNAADRAKSEKDAEELSNLYRLWSSVCLELGNYLSGNLKERDTNLRKAETYAQKATDLNKRNLEAWDALAYALEDAAWLLKENAKYPQAVKAFDQAIQINFRSDRPRSWLGR